MLNLYCGCRKPCPGRSSGVVGLAEEYAEAIVPRVEWLVGAEAAGRGVTAATDVCSVCARTPRTVCLPKMSSGQFRQHVHTRAGCRRDGHGDGCVAGRVG